MVQLLLEQHCGSRFARNTKKIWSFIKSNKNDNTGVSPLKAKNDINYSDSTLKVTTLNELFVCVVNKDEDASTIPDMVPSTHHSMDTISVTEEGLYKLFSNLRVHKAMGPDEIPTRLLKDIAEELTPISTLFYQACLDQGTKSDGWKMANVVPNFKR